MGKQRVKPFRKRKAWKRSKGAPKFQFGGVQKFYRPPASLQDILPFFRMLVKGK